MTAIPVLVLVFVVMTATAHRTSLNLNDESATVCSSLTFRRECLAAHSECGFCCSAPVGQQCFNRSSSVTCPPPFTISNASSTKSGTEVTCESLCSSLGSNNCTTCVGLVWCYFCHTTSACIGPTSHCPEGTVMQTCGAAIPHGGSDSSDNDDLWFHVVIYTTISAAGLLLILGLGVGAQRFRRRLALNQLFRPEARPLLSPTNVHQNAEASTRGEDAMRPSDHVVAPPSSSVVGEEHPMSTHTAVAVNTDMRSTVTSPAAADASAGEPPHYVAVVDHHSCGSSSTSDRLCQLCFDNEAVIAFLPCYHVHCCMQCANRIRPSRSVHRHVSCPFCRQKIRTMVLLTSLVQKKVA
jgi:hypothetical protein